MKSLKLTFVAIIFSMSFMGYSFGQKGITNMTDTIPVDPNVIIGKLDNGLIYYIRKNTKPENRVELRLAVNAGSINENKSQLGLAHFVEHMCFNGTKTFEGNKMIDYLQKYGISFGGDLNAYTSFDETVYMLKVPTDNKNLLDTALQIIVDWSNYVAFNSKEIDKERGIITEEWRLGLGADDRLMKKYFPVAFKNSMYADRLPIGEIDVINIPICIKDLTSKFLGTPEIIKVISRAVDIMCTEILINDINITSKKNKESIVNKKYRNVPIYIISPKKCYGNNDNGLDFSKELISEAIDHGKIVGEDKSTWNIL